MTILSKLGNVWSNLTRDPEPVVLTGEQKSALDRTLAAVINNKFVEWDMSDPTDVYLHPVINRAINLLATNVAQLPLRVYTKDNKEYEGELPFDFDRPNDYQSGYDFWMLAIAQRLVNNEIIIRKQVEGNRVINLFLYDSSVAKENVNKQTGRIVSWKLDKEIVPAEEVIHIPGIVLKGFRPNSLSEIVKNDFLADIKSSEFIRFFFENFSQLGGYLYYDGKEGVGPTPDQMQKLVEQLNQAHQGSAKSYKLAGLTGGVKYEEVGQTIKEMDFNLSKDNIRDRFLLHLGVHKAVVGVTESVDRAVADTAMRAVWQLTLKPLALQIEAKLNTDPNLYKPMNLHCAWDFTDVEELKEDQLSKAELATKYLAFGYSRNEINEKLQLEFEEDTEYGDMQFVPSNLIPISDVVNPPEPVLSNPPEEDEGKLIDDLLEKSVRKDKISKEIKTYTRNFNKLQRKNEKIIKSKIKKHLFEQRSDCLRIILNHGSKDITKYTILSDIRSAITGSTDEFKKKIRPVYELTYTDGMGLANRAVGSTGGAINQSVIESRLALLDSIDRSTYKSLVPDIVESIKQGETLTQMADRVKAKFNEMSTVRSTMVARTESSALLNNAAHERYKEAGIQYKSWGEPKSRESHFGNMAEGTIPFDQHFQNGQIFPHDGIGGAEENINCTCCLIPEIQ